jgi:hypothetical protein
VIKYEEQLNASVENSVSFFIFCLSGSTWGCESFVVDLLNWMPISEWSMARKLYLQTDIKMTRFTRRLDYVLRIWTLF